MRDENTTLWREWGKSAVLLGMSIYLILLILGGNLDNYINISLIWLTWLAVGLLLLLGLWSAWQLLKRHNLARQHDVGDYQHPRVSWWSVGIVGLPLFFALAFPSRPLDASAAQSVSLSPIGGRGMAASFSIPPEQRNILDWLREFSRVGNPASFEGQRADVIGFIYREPDMSATQFMVARFSVSCCVADAFALGLPVEYASAAEFETGAWVRITGTLSAGEFMGQSIPILQPELIEPTDIPETPYLYG